MSSKPISPMRRAWYKWKALRLPWRKRFLVGLDLSGNTFWEFKDALSSTPGRMRRIVQYPPSTHYSEVSGGISPAWHQWLRRTRSDPPSLTEQSQDLIRQRNLKVLAAEADARWAAKPSFLDAPARTKESAPALESARKSSTGLENELHQGIGTRATVEATTNKLESEGPNQKQRPNEGRFSFGEGEDEGKEIRQAETKPKKTYKEDPWARTGPSEGWQPQAWDPNVGVAKR